MRFNIDFVNIFLVACGSYQYVYHDVIGSNPNVKDIEKCVCEEKKRPVINDKWKSNAVSNDLMINQYTEAAHRGVLQINCSSNTEDGLYSKSFCVKLVPLFLKRPKCRYPLTLKRP